MSETDNWLLRYERNHADLQNPFVYWAAVPMVVIGTVGLLWSLPVPVEFYEISPFLNWGSVFLMAATVYYFIISLSIAIGMLPFMLGLATLQLWLTGSDYPALRGLHRPARRRHRWAVAGPSRQRSAWLRRRRTCSS